MVELLIWYFDFLTWSLSFWWTTLTEPKSWYWYPPLIIACIFYFGLILALSGWAVSLALALISIPIYGLQKLTGFKIPLIGAYIDKAWAESAKNVDQDALRSIENEQIKAAIIFNNRELSNDELRCVHKIFGTDDGLQLFAKIAEATSDLSKEDSEYFEKQFASGDLDKWISSYVHYNPY
ncbi:hypothetical protein N9X05_01765 [Paracoccaceae bacterium]|nr:hypothetical protein [Paracoccaceae bacterium]